jgi:uncharacterized membrane protein YozB (DUF420 family)
MSGHYFHQFAHLLAHRLVEEDKQKLHEDEIYLIFFFTIFFFMFYLIKENLI